MDENKKEEGDEKGDGDTSGQKAEEEKDLRQLLPNSLRSIQIPPFRVKEQSSFDLDGLTRRGRDREEARRKFDGDFHDSRAERSVGGGCCEE